MATARSSTEGGHDVELQSEKKTQLSPTSSHDGKVDPSTPVPDVVHSKSKGVRQMEILYVRLQQNKKLYYAIFAFFTILAFVMSLDQYTASTYLTEATSVSFKAHSVLATVNVVKSVFQAVSQPPIAKFSDVFGRVNAYILCVCFYGIGYAITASSPSIYVYSVGNCIYILGITGLFLLQNIITADITPLNMRLFWSIFPSIPGVINGWVSGDVTASVLTHTTWRWGYGMFCILVPALALPIIITLAINMRALPKTADSLSDDIAPQPEVEALPKRSLGQRAISVFWELDFVGLFLLVGGFGLLLVSITLANSRRTTWSSPQTIVMIVLGAVATMGFFAWTRYGARNPILPFWLIKNRTLVICILISLLHPIGSGVSGQYLNTFFRVAADQSVKSAARLGNLPVTTSTLTVVIAGLVTRYLRRLKYIIIFGACVKLLGLGLMIRFRTSTNSQIELGAVQIVRGIGAGCLGFPTQTAVQSAAKHEHVAAITACYLLVYYLAGGIGSAIGGGIWTAVVPGKIEQYMGNPALAASAYRDPITFARTWAMGTPERIAISRAHDETQRIMVLSGIGFTAALLIVACLLEDIRLPDSQSRSEVEAEEDDESIRARVKKEQVVLPNATGLQ